MIEAARSLVIICCGCGEPMRNLGEWPIQYPREDKHKNIVQGFRYHCKTCKIPSPNFKPGYECSIAIVGEEVTQ